MTKIKNAFRWVTNTALFLFVFLVLYPLLWLEMHWTTKFLGRDVKSGQQEYLNRDIDSRHFASKRAGYLHYFEKEVIHERKLNFGNLDVNSLYPHIISPPGLL